MQLTKRRFLSALLGVITLPWFGVRRAAAEPVPATSPAWDGLPDLSHPMHMVIERISSPLDGPDRARYMGNYGGKQNILFNAAGMRATFRARIAMSGAGWITIYGTLDNLWEYGVREVYGPVKLPYGRFDAQIETQTQT